MSPTAAPPASAADLRWSLALWGGGLCGIAAIFMQPLQLWFRMLSDSAEESLGLTVPPIVAFLVWRRREQLWRIPVRPSVGGAVLFMGTVVLAAVCTVAWFGTGTRFALWCTLGALTWAVWGGRWFRTLLVPFLLLCFALPLPVTLERAVTLPLRLVVTNHAADTLGVLGVAAVSEGVLLHLSTTTLETTAACSGMRGFIAGLAMALVLWELFPGRWVPSVVLFPGALLAAYVLNVVRIMLEVSWVMASGAPSPSWLHTLFGLFTFAGVAGLLTAWQRRVHRNFAS